MRRRVLDAGLLAVPGGWLAIFFALPLAIVVAISFGTTDDLGRPRFGWNPDNYSVVLSRAMLSPFAHSLLYAGATTVICLIVTYPAAYTIARYGGGARYPLVALLLLPWFVDYLVRIYAWIAIFGDVGLANHILEQLGLPAVRVLNTSLAVIGGLVYSYYPLMVLAIYAAVERMDDSLIEAGQDLYGGPWQTFRHVTLPTTASGVVAGCLLVFLPATGDFVNAQLLGGPGTSMVGNLVQSQFAGGGYWPYGAAMSLVLIVLLGAAMALYLRRTMLEQRQAA